MRSDALVRTLQEVVNMDVFITTHPAWVVQLAGPQVQPPSERKQAAPS
jgi:hypothetical protein